MRNIVRAGELYTSVINRASSRENTKSAYEAEVSFDRLLNGAWLKLSQHAFKRMEQRGIELGEDQLQKISLAVDKAAAKGAKETLVLMKDTAFIVSVKNRTIVTAVNGTSLSEGVFTQIDSAVIIP